MALPTDSRQIDDLLTETTDLFMDDAYDFVYKSNALFVRLKTKDRVVEGGAEIRQGFIYDKVPGGAYISGQAFDTSITKTKTQFVWPWVRYYAGCNIDALQEILNEGPHRILDTVEIIIEQGRMRISDDIGNDIINSAAVDNTAISGLAAYVNDGTLGSNASYGGITYGTDTLGASIKATVDTGGGPVSISATNANFGKTTIQPTKPDLLLTTQTIWDKFYDRVQPSQRIEDPGYNDLTRVGFSVIKFNAADLVADSHVPSGYIYGLTTDYLELITLRGRNMVFEGWFRPASQDQRIGQVLWCGNLKGVMPRVNFVMSGLT